MDAGRLIRGSANEELFEWYLEAKTIESECLYKGIRGNRNNRNDKDDGDDRDNKYGSNNKASTILPS